MLFVTKKRILPVVALTGAALFGQLRPGTSIEVFQLPLFDEAGYRVWQLQGDLVTYRSETQITIEGMTVEQFVGDDNNKQIAELTSPEAIFHYDTTTAFGPGELHIESDNFEVTGYDWIWLGEKKQITFNKDVTVILYEGVGDILK